MKSSQIRSQVLNKEVPFCYEIPKTINGLLVVLHGLGDNERGFFQNVDYKSISEEYGLIIISPFADRSWYIDTYSGEKYFTFFKDEFLDLIQEKLDLDFNKIPKIISGFSMGGYGAIKQAAQTNIYDSVIAFAPSCDIIQRKKLGWYTDEEINYLFGDTIDDSNDLLKVANNITIPFYICCGKEDYVLPFVEAFQKTLDIDHEYLNDHGEHDWIYVDKHLKAGLKYCLGKLDTKKVY